MPERTRKQILAVDDEPDVPYRLKRYVERNFPIDVTIAHNGKVALDILATKRFDAMVTDLDMPVMNGFLLTEEAMKLYPWMIIIVITGSGDQGFLSRSAGARFILKLIKLEDLAVLIYQHFGFMKA